jgi:acyl-CoA thioesterase
MTPLQRAKKSAEIMWERDKASKGIGIKLERISPGEADLSLLVESKHLNGHDICHGGFIFTLADSAFAFACNSYNQAAVAQNNMITFIAPAQKGDKLLAKAREVSRSGRSGIYDVSVLSQDQKKIAEFRGHSRTIGGQN